MKRLWVSIAAVAALIAFGSWAITTQFGATALTADTQYVIGKLGDLIKGEPVALSAQ